MHKWESFSKAQRKPCMQNLKMNYKQKPAEYVDWKDRNSEAHELISGKKKEMLFL